MEYEDRPYQSECLDALGASGAHRNLLILPTGSGKTYIFSRYSAQIPGRTLMISHRREIIHQTAKTVEQVTGIHPGIVMGKENEVAADTIVASIQTLSRRSRLLQLPEDVELIVIDEAHHIAADTYKRLLYRYGLIDKFTCGINNAKGITPVFSEDRKLLGVTATPNRTDEIALDPFFDAIPFRLSTLDLIPEYLTDFSCLSVNTGVDLSGVRTRKGDLAEGQLGEEMLRQGLIAELPRVIADHLADRDRILIFLPTVATCEQAASELCFAGINARCVVGKTPRSERQRTLNDFATGDVRVVVNCMVLTEGFDCPEIDALVIARPTKSGMLIQQMVGRGLRKVEGKTDCRIIDLAFTRRQQDLISVASSGLFGGFQELHFEAPEKSILELIALQNEKAAYLQTLVNHLAAVSEKKREVERGESPATEEDIRQITDASEEIHLLPGTYIPLNTVESVVLLLDTAMLRDLLGDKVSESEFWKQFAHKFAGTSTAMRDKIITTAQASLLAKLLNVPVEDLNILNRAGASALIGTLIVMDPITDKQYFYLSEVMGFAETDIPATKQEAIELIGILKTEEMRDSTSDRGLRRYSGKHVSYSRSSFIDTPRQSEELIADWDGDDDLPF